MSPQIKNDVTQLSPAAQAVHDAFWSHPNGEPLSQDSPDTDQLIAALRAAADQVVPEFWHEDNDIYGETMQDVRENLLAIADELEDA